MRRIHRWLLCLAIVVLAGGPRVSAAPPSPAVFAGVPLVRFKAVLIAGDRSEPVFDRATQAMRERLLARNVPAADILRLSASRAVVWRDGALPSNLDNVLAAIDGMHPAPGEGCLVFATSHGAPEDGLVLTVSENFLTPQDLDRALLRGCGDAPTVVIISGCFSGSFAQSPMTRPNRIVLTAARADRPSFGCGAGEQYTFFDRCLLDSMDRSATWRATYTLIRACVSARERAMRYRSSDPRAWFGGAVEGMALPSGG